MPLSRKHIVLGVSGGIAAYKAAEIVRLLVKQGAQVQVVMTASAQQFIGEMTFQALSSKPVRRAVFDSDAEAAMGHIELARWADVILVAPATANTLARLACGLADDLLGTLWLASAAVKIVAPAMNQQMWQAPATQRNVAQLLAHGTLLSGPDDGEQACGDIGPGRMAAPETIVAVVEQILGHPQPVAELSGQTVVITAGPTREAIDPVRFLGNRSSGKMGFALARAFQRRGARVILIAGHCTQPTPTAVTRVDVESARDMLQAAQHASVGADIFVGCAAVSDYRLERPAAAKIKKTRAKLVLTLVQNPDIISEIAHSDARPGRVIGFAAETHNLLEYARDKLTRKNLDLICANEISATDSGFAVDQNHIWLLHRDRTEATDLGLQAKTLLAERIVDAVIALD